MPLSHAMTASQQLLQFRMLFFSSSVVFKTPHEARTLHQRKVNCHHASQFSTFFGQLGVIPMTIPKTLDRDISDRAACIERIPALLVRPGEVGGRTNDLGWPHSRQASCNK